MKCPTRRTPTVRERELNNEPMTDPTEHFDDELLSAYVDGELAGAELALVEQRLVDDPRAQNLVEELRALSQEMQSIPPQAVGDDLRATILQRAERAMLLGTEEQQSSRPHGAGSSRRWMWPAMALAATLLLTVFLPNAQQEEKPLASAKPVPGEPKQAEPRLEPVATEEEVIVLGEEFESQDGETLTDSVDEVAAPSAIRSRAAMSSAPSSASGGAGFAAAEVTTKPVADEVQPDFQVVLTLNKSTDGLEHFNRLLLSNGITLEETSQQEQDSDRSGQENAAADSSYFATRRGNTKELSETQQSMQEDVVLVEATTEQIENLLEACNADTRNLTSIHLVTQQKTTNRLFEQWQQWGQQWERGGKQLAQNKLQNLKRKKQAIRQSQLGRAMQLDVNQYSRQSNGVMNFEHKLLAKNTSPAIANPESQALESQVQVFFILQQISNSVPGEPASAGGNR